MQRAKTTSRDILFSHPMLENDWVCIKQYSRRWKLYTPSRDNLIQIWLTYTWRNWGPGEEAESGRWLSWSGSLVFWQPGSDLFFLPNTVSQGVKSERFSPQMGGVAKPATWIIFLTESTVCLGHHRHSQTLISSFPCVWMVLKPSREAARLGSFAKKIWKSK